MKTSKQEFKFVVTPEKGKVTAIYDKPDSPKVMLGHESSSNIRHHLMEELSTALNHESISTMRFNYPYSEKGKVGMNGEKIRLATVHSAINMSFRENEKLPLFVDGHSMRGRIFSMAQVRNLEKAVRNYFYDFSLYSDKPNVECSGYLKKIDIPMLFLSGQRNRMANLDLLEPIVSGLANGILHVVDTGNDGFKVSKRRSNTRTSLN